MKGFFEKEKLDTNTYRRFRIVDRDTNQFLEYSYQGNTNSNSIQVTPQKATVWCRNDYLGMSRHPELGIRSHHVSLIVKSQLDVI